MPAALAPGFADPVFAAQAVFRAVLDALARPGILQDLGAGLRPPAPLTPELAAVALALADADAPLWLDPALAAARPVRDYLRFHTGARLTEDPREAAFALVSDPGRLPPFGAFAQGTDAYPDRSTTIAVAVAALSGGQPIGLSGPGIRDGVAIEAALPADFAHRLRSNHALFPCGIDLLLVSEGRVVGVPRSSSVVGAA